MTLTDIMPWKIVHVTCLLLASVLTLCNFAMASNNVEMFEVKPLSRTGISTYNITIQILEKVNVCEKKFMSFTIDSSNAETNWAGFNFTSIKLQNLAEALVPTDLRFGGTKADFLIFNVNPAQDSVKIKGGYVEDAYDRLNAPVNFNMSGKQWDQLANFAKKVGWDIIFDFNVFIRRQGVWDPSNAELFLNYTSTNGLQIPFFQLGNEPDLYERDFSVTITPKELVTDFKILRNLISSYALYRNSLLFGPGVTNLGVNARSKIYLQEFIEAGGAEVVNEIGIHHYYMNGATAKLQDFLNVTILDSLKTVIDVALNLTRAASHPIPVRLSETSSCYGGGAPGISDAYAAGFLWLDKLGIAARSGLSRVFRQDFLGGSYALVTSTSFDPNPDFYLSVLFKRLVEGPVFPVTSAPPLGQLRVYANCARRDIFSYPAGAVVLYYLNVGEEEATLHLTQFSNYSVDLFALTPGDDHGLLSRFVKLNGEVLLMSGDDVPEMSPSHQSGDVTVAAQSFGFIVIPEARVPACGYEPSE